MTDIKKLIKESLRNMLEAKSRFDSDDADVFRTMFKISKAYEMFGPHSSKNDDLKQYFNEPEDGQYIYTYIVHPNGFVRVGNMIASARVREKNIGITKVTGSYMEITIAAGRGIEHGVDGPRTSVAITRRDVQSTEEDMTANIEYFSAVKESLGSVNKEAFNNPQILNFINSQDPQTEEDVRYIKPGSPASDGALKCLLNYGDDILYFVIKNNGKFDAYTTFGDATSTEKFKNQNANTLKNHNFRMKYKELTGDEPSKREIDKFFDSGETDIDKYLQALGVGRTERSLVDPSKETGEERKARMDAERAAKKAKILARKQKGGL